MSERKTAAKSRAKKTETPDKITAKELLNFRSGPGYEHDVIRVLKPGEALTLCGKMENGFTEVTDPDGETGWVCMDYVEVISLD